MGTGFEYSIPKPKLSYDFFENASIYFKAYHSEAVYNKMIPVYNPNNIEALDKYNKDNNTSLTMSDYNKLFSPYETWYYGNCRYCELKRAVFTVPMIIAKIKEQMNKKDLTGNYIVDFELEWTEGNDVTHFPMRDDDSINPNGKYIIVDKDGYPVSIVQDKKDCLSTVRFYRRHHYNVNGEISDVSDRCEFELILSEDKNTIYVYAWIVNISFYDETKRMYMDQADNRPFLVSDYITNISDLDKENKKQFSERFFLDFMQPYIIGDGNILMLESINTIDVYSYNGQGEYGFSSLLLTEGAVPSSLIDGASIVSNAFLCSSLSGSGLDGKIIRFPSGSRRFCRAAISTSPFSASSRSDAGVVFSSRQSCCIHPPPSLSICSTSHFCLCVSP